MKASDIISRYFGLKAEYHELKGEADVMAAGPIYTDGMERVKDLEQRMAAIESQFNMLLDMEVAPVKFAPQYKQPTPPTLN